jgi:hypothetical protein
MYQSKVGLGVFVGRRRRKDVQIWIRKAAGLLPKLHATFRAWVERERMLFWTPALALGI